MPDDSIKLSALEIFILRMLTNYTKELYGLEMVKHSNGRLKMGTIYVTLDRMEDKGLIKSRKEKRRNGARGLPRRLYKLSAFGSRALNNWEMASTFGELA